MQICQVVWVRGYSLNTCVGDILVSHADHESRRHMFLEEGAADRTFPGHNAKLVQNRSLGHSGNKVAVCCSIPDRQQSSRSVAVGVSIAVMHSWRPALHRKGIHSA